MQSLPASEHGGAVGVVGTDFANGSDVALVGSAWLAGFAEDELRGAAAADELIGEGRHWRGL